MNRPTAIGLNAFSFMEREWRSVVKCFIPAIFLAIMSEILGAIPAFADSIAAIFGILSTIASMFGAIGAMRYVNGQLSHTPVALEEAKRVPLGDVWRYIRTGILFLALSLFALLIAALAALAVAKLIFASAPFSSLTSAIVFGVFIALVIITILGGAFHMAQYVCIVDKTGAWESMRRAFAMSKPYRFSLVWRIILSEMVFTVRFFFRPPILILTVLMAVLAWSKLPIAILLVSLIGIGISYAFLITGQTYIVVSYALALKEQGTAKAS
jgi:hypothetical protein